MAVKFFNDGLMFRFPNKRRVGDWIVETARREGLGTGDISVIFCSSDRHLEINRRYLSHDYNTDVITFDYSGDGVISGDIFIDPATVKDNAGIYGRPAKEELMRVVIHGVLHLIGYNDKEPAEQVAMREAEDRCLVLWDESFAPQKSE